MLENTSDIKDNNDTRTLINKLNNDNTRYDYQSEKNNSCITSSWTS